MKRLIILLIFPVLGFGQQGNENWPSPFTSVEFEGGQIIFTVAETSQLCSIYPIYLIPGEFILKFDPTHVADCQEIKNGTSLIGNYLENPENNVLFFNDQIRYIKAFALQTFLALSGEKMPSATACDKIISLSVSASQVISDNARTALSFYKNIEKSLAEQYGNVEYLKSNGEERDDFNLFSSDELLYKVPVKVINQQTDSIAWPKFFGEPSRLDYCKDVIETYDKGYIVLGGYNNEWSWIIKTDINGNVLWDKVIDCDGKNKFFEIDQTDDGGFIIAGRASLFENITDPVVVKINACGEKEWCKVFRTPDHLDFAYGIIAQDYGSSVVLTLYNSYIPGENIHLHKLDTEGNILWKKEYAKVEDYPDIHSPTAYELIKTNDNGFMLTGFCYWPDPNNPNLLGLRPLYIKVNSQGKEEWLLPFGINDYIYGEATNIAELANNRYIGFADRRNDPEPITPLLIFINSDGIVSSYSEFINDSLFNNYVDAYFDGGIFINDKILAILSHNHVYSTTGLFGAVVIDTLLNLYQAREIDTALSPFTLLKSQDLKFLTSANSNEFQPYSSTDIMMFKLNEQLNYDTVYPGNFTYDSLCTTPGLPQSGFIYLDDCDIITSYDEILSPEEYYAFVATIPINAYPNPAETEITLAFQNTDHHTNMVLECYNIYGQKVHNEKIWKGQQETRIDLRGWASALYFTVVKSDGKVAGTGRFVRR